MRPSQADIIKIAAVVTATPRWTGALLLAEGFDIPSSWLAWWIPASALFGVAMAVVEGWSFAYVFASWRNQRDKSARNLLWLALASAVIFVIVLTPFVADRVRRTSMGDLLGSGWALWIWSAAVASSTISIVASVGYAQKQPREPRQQAQAPVLQAQSKPEEAQEEHFAKCNVDGCNWSGMYSTERGAQNALTAHRRKHK